MASSSALLILAPATEIHPIKAHYRSPERAPRSTPQHPLEAAWGGTAATIGKGLIRDR
jgi:hypothetical protein